jgi:hypothetical protein
MKNRSPSQKPQAVNFRLASTLDYSALTSFYTANEHPNVAFRAHRLTHLLEQRSFVLAESGDTLVAAGGVEFHEFSGSRPYVELIQGRVLRSGAGLYRLLIAWRVLVADVTYNGEATIFCEIDEINRQARSIYEGMGFQRFTPCAELSTAAIELLPQDKRPIALGYNFIWYFLPAMAKDRLLGALRVAVISNDYRIFIGPDKVPTPSAGLRHMATLRS